MIISIVIVVLLLLHYLNYKRILKNYDLKRKKEIDICIEKWRIKFKEKGIEFIEFNNYYEIQKKDLGYKSLYEHKRNSLSEICDFDKYFENKLNE